MTEPTDQRVVFVIEALTVGGAEQMLVSLANLFLQRGWETHMICLTTAGELAESLDAGVTLHVLNKKPGVDVGLPGKLRKLVRELNPSAINCHLWTANTWTRISLLGAGFPVFATEHSRDTWKGKHYRLIDRLLAFAMSKMVAVSGDTADFYINTIGVNADKVTVINNGIDTARYRDANGEELRQQFADSGELLIGTVGRMVEAKNHPRLVEVAARLRDVIKPFRVVFVGDGPERENLERCIEQHGVSDLVQLTGARSDVPDILHALDIFVLSSDREGHPLTALEAQAAGTPVVLTSAGGSADAIASEKPVTQLSNATVIKAEEVTTGGLLVEKSTDALFDGICQLANDEALRLAMGEYGREQTRAQFDRQTMVDRYESLFLGA